MVVMVMVGLLHRILLLMMCDCNVFAVLTLLM